MPSDLASRWSDPTQPAFVIAEAGVNHNGDPELARRLVDAAAAAGADAVKFQTFRAEALVTRTAAKAAYQARNDPRTATQFEMLKALELGEADFAALKAQADGLGIAFLSTPFDEDSADLLARLGVAAFKVSSGDLTHPAFLAHVARHGRPMIVSTGMATLGEVLDATAAIGAAGDPPLALLHCVSNYPADPADANLRAMATIAAATGKPVGWSDHTEGEAVSFAAVALGARIVEKHLTLSRAMDGPDHRASMEPNAFARFVAGIREVEAALGSARKEPSAAELKVAEVARRSLVAAVDIPAGGTLSASTVAVRRPGTGIAPKHLPLVLGRTTRVAIAAHQPLAWEMLA
ncbi:MAG: N-acetylneuraminate synthase [Bauldia sp.]|nr:N-acetylneuraminate synthase [Bauldia sp.]